MAHKHAPLGDGRRIDVSAIDDFALHRSEYLFHSLFLLNRLNAQDRAIVIGDDPFFACFFNIAKDVQHIGFQFTL